MQTRVCSVHKSIHLAWCMCHSVAVTDFSILALCSHMRNLVLTYRGNTVN